MVMAATMVEMAMTLLTHPGEGPAFSLCRPADAHPWPIPHAHDEFDEAIYVLSGRLLVTGDDEPEEAVPGSMLTAPRGHQHGFSNPSGEPARLLGLWVPPEPALLSCGTSVPR
jgi:mannose-6-phosphate isomerase-like protein (cupin superfamily)